MCLLGSEAVQEQSGPLESKNLQMMISASCLWKLGLYPLLLSAAAAVLKPRPSNLDLKILQVNTVGSEKLKCFTQTLEDFTCVWDERNNTNNSSQYRFFYQYQYQDDERKKECQLSTEEIANNTTRHICSLPMMEVSLFTPLDIEVLLNRSVVMNRKEMYINHMVVLDPPSNVTVRPTGKPGQLHVKWSAPPFKYLDNSLMYEVNFSSVGSNIQQVNTVKGKTECVILKLKSQTEYVIQIRAKPDGVSMDGYWTTWSKPVSAFTDSDLDPLILGLTSILILITSLLLLTIILTYRRMIKETVWPLIPSPENMFDGLFTVHQGNFQEWLGRGNVQIWWNLQFFGTDEPSTALEILSEINTFPPGLLRNKHQEIFPEDRGFLMSGSGTFKLQQEWMPLDESKSPEHLQPEAPTREAYVVLNQNLLLSNDFLSGTYNVTHSSSDVSEEEMPLQLLFWSPEMKHHSKTSPEEGRENFLSHDSISQHSSQSSGIECESPASFGAFDYAKCDPAGHLLYPSPSEAVLENTNHPYLLMLDSGISADFSLTNFPSRVSKSDEGLYTNLCKREDLHENFPVSSDLHIEV
ncbi:erythropoietin receptor [Hemitrygon akajei]|uniref:erythropoietin receptor n=1 Tax=Hemitrygon akajei TaxID=2704970 RepID=UPI003BF9EECE